MLSIDIVRDEDRFLLLETEWDALLRQSSSDGLFLTWNWVLAWWVTFRHQYRLRVVTIRENGRLQAIGPWVIGPCPSSTLGFIGQNIVWGEYLDVIVMRGLEATLTGTLVDAVLGGATGEPARIQRVDFRFVLDDAAGRPHWIEAFRAQGRPLSLYHKDIGHFLSLDRGWDGFLATRSPKMRAHARRGLRFVERAGAEIRWVGKDLSLEHGLSEYARLSALRWSRPLREGLLCFITAYARRLIPLDELVFPILYVGDKAVATRIDFLYRRKLWCYQGGWDPALASDSPGTALLTTLVHWCVEHSVVEYDFLVGDAEYKRRFGTGTRRVGFWCWPERA